MCWSLLTILIIIFQQLDIMTSSHTQFFRKSSSKRNVFALLLQSSNVRSEFRFKVAADRLVRHFRIVKIVFFVTNQSTLSSSFQFVDSKVVIELFQQQRQKCIVQLFFEKQNFFARHFNSAFDIENIQKRRIFYTREIKLAVINYAFIVTKLRGRFINRYMIAKKLKITITMLKNWITKQHEIESYKKKVRKVRSAVDRKFTMKSLLIEKFVETRDKNRKINKRWFIHNVKAIYQRLYSERVNRDENDRIQYQDFCFSLNWFMKYRRRNDIAIRRSTKIVQKINYSFNILQKYIFLYDIC